VLYFVGIASILDADGGVFMNNKIGFVGAGNMGSAILCGAVEKAGFEKCDISVCSLEVSDKVKSLNINVTNLQEVIANSDYIMLCVKPNSFENLLSDIKGTQGYSDKVYVSIAAGITIDYIKSILGDVKVIRTMPNINTSVSISENRIIRLPRISSASSRPKYNFCTPAVVMDRSST